MRRIAFSIILLSIVSFSLVQCKKDPSIAKDISQQFFNKLKNKVSDLENMLKKAGAGIATEAAVESASTAVGIFLTALPFLP
ncbi:hypothetical protein KAT08_02310 [Candidatus Babeliales bacterium]|nr:hypothetical protein [Candidatus Babeliales bacterium]